MNYPPVRTLSSGIARPEGTIERDQNHGSQHLQNGGFGDAVNRHSEVDIIARRNAEPLGSSLESEEGCGYWVRVVDRHVADPTDTEQPGSDHQCIRPGSHGKRTDGGHDRSEEHTSELP